MVYGVNGVQFSARTSIGIIGLTGSVGSIEFLVGFI